MAVTNNKDAVFVILTLRYLFFSTLLVVGDCQRCFGCRTNTNNGKKTKTNDKCIEVPLYAIKGKLFGKEFEIEAFKDLDEGTIDFANLILPDKAFAEAFIKYLKERRD